MPQIHGPNNRAMLRMRHDGKTTKLSLLEFRAWKRGFEDMFISKPQKINRNIAKSFKDSTSNSPRYKQQIMGIRVKTPSARLCTQGLTYQRLIFGGDVLDSVAK